MPKTIPPLITMMQELVSTLSVSSPNPVHDTGNRAVIDKLADWLSTLGLNVDIMPLNEKGDKANMIATLGSGTGGLVLSGHTDTVPFDEPLWSYNPLDLTEADNKLFGLGSTDMKGFFPLIIEATKDFVDQPLREPLTIVATADEESTMHGARELVKRGAVQARAAVIGEPTLLTPMRLHKGVMMEAITIQGRSGHSSNPALGNNALEAMHTVIGDIMQFRQQLQEQYQNPLFDIAVPTMNLGCIHGGDSPNRICGQCELHFDVRMLPGMDAKDIEQRIIQRLKPIAEKAHIDIQLRPLTASIPAFEQAQDSDLVQLAQQFTGKQAISAAYATEGPFLQQLGMETIVMGPGSIDQAHQPDEYMAVDQIKPAVALYKKLIQHYCL